MKLQSWVEFFKLPEKLNIKIQPECRIHTSLEQELIAWCRERLSHIKCPRSVDFERALPRSDAGKLFKRRIRDRYWQGRDSLII